MTELSAGRLRSGCSMPSLLRLSSAWESLWRRSSSRHSSSSSRLSRRSGRFLQRCPWYSEAQLNCVHVLPLLARQQLGVGFASGSLSDENVVIENHVLGAESESGVIAVSLLSGLLVW